MISAFSWVKCHGSALAWKVSRVKGELWVNTTTISSNGKNSITWESNLIMNNVKKWEDFEYTYVGRDVSSWGTENEWILRMKMSAFIIKEWKAHSKSACPKGSLFKAQRKSSRGCISLWMGCRRKRRRRVGEICRPFARWTAQPYGGAIRCLPGICPLGCTSLGGTCISMEGGACTSLGGTCTSVGGACTSLEGGACTSLVCTYFAHRCCFLEWPPMPTGNPWPGLCPVRAPSLVLHMECSNVCDVLRSHSIQ